MKYGYFSSPIGQIVISEEEDLIREIKFSENIILKESHSDLILEAKKALQKYFSCGECDFLSKLYMDDFSDFQKTVYEEVCTIPTGVTASYGGVSKAVCARLNLDKMSSLAVGGALSKNPFAIIIPCHRIIKASGVFGKYRWGADRKKFLLDFEKTRLEV